MPIYRPLPPIPELDISEESVLIAAEEMQVWINHAFSLAHEIAIDGNLKTLIAVRCHSFCLSWRFCVSLAMIGIYSCILCYWFLRLFLAYGWYLLLAAFLTSLRWFISVSWSPLKFVCITLYVYNRTPMTYRSSLIFISAVLLSLSVPFLYERFQTQVDEKLIVVHKIAHSVMRQADTVLRMIPLTHKQKSQ